MTINAWGSDKILNEVNGGTSENSYASGDILYASAANTLSKLSAGSDTQVLELSSGLPSWQAASAGSNFSFISEQSASASSSIEFTDIGTSPLYVLYITNFVPSTGGYLEMLTSTDNGSSYDSGASDYAYSYQYASSSATSGVGDSSNGAIRFSISQTVSISNHMIYFFNPSGGGYTFFCAQSNCINSTRGYSNSWGQGTRKATESVDAVQFRASSGTITTGKFTLFEVTA